MRIAMISENASPLAAIGGVDAGGQNIYVAHVARCLAQAGHEVDVFTRKDNASIPTVVAWAPRLRVIHVHAGPPAFVPKERLLDFMPEFARFCKTWLQNAPLYDVIHANFFMSGWVGLRLKEWFGLPLVTTFHALGLVRKQHQKEADVFPEQRIEIERELALRSDVVVAECPQDRADLQELYSARAAQISMVPCGFDSAELTPGDRAQARERLGIPQDEFTVLQVGRMVRRKGIETVVRAMAEPVCRDMRLRILGGESATPDPQRTPEIARLQAVAHECGVSARVIFEGCKPRQALSDWYAAADVFVTTPWHEPFGITPLEAMACARPVVGSAVGGVKYSIQDGVTGLLVPPRQPRALATALATLRADPAKAQAMGEAGLQRAQRMFTWQSVATQLGAVFERATRTSHLSAGGTLMQHSIFHVQDSVLCKALPARFSLSAALRPKQRAIFLDKDGTLIEDVPYNVDPARLRFTPRAFEALHLWRDAGYRFVVVTNQSGLHQGRFDRAALSALHNALEAQLAQGGITLDGFFACPHLEDEKCECRKPQPGLLLEAARMLNLDLENSWMVGDILNDVEAGQRAGCSSVLLDVGHETEWLSGPLRIPELRCKDLLEAARATLKSSGHATHVADDARIEAAS